MVDFLNSLLNSVVRPPPSHLTDFVNQWAILPDVKTNKESDYITDICTVQRADRG